MAVDFTSLIGSTQAQSPELTLAAKKEAFANQFKAAIAQQFASRIQTAKDLYNAIWKNGQLSPKQAILSLGTDAAAAFALCAAEAQYLNGFKPGSFEGSLPEGVSITFNADGSLKEYIEA